MLQKYKTEMLGTFWDSCTDQAFGALSEMIQRDVKKIKPSIHVETINNVPNMLNPKEITTTLVYTLVNGEIKCTVVFSSSLRHFLRLIDILLKKKIDYYDALNEENEPVVIELGNIINGYIVSSLNRLFESKFDFNESVISVNPYRAIEDFDFGNIYKEKVRLLTFKSGFSVHGEDIQGKLLLLLNDNKTDMLLEAIVKKIIIK
ncbi:MAG: hypothetical protein JW700_03620 [Candidatus Aenigmarchaeota archaeon]|nr:hypothetical protein [Candidatus Aenigmarchaeota archaeon]